MKKGIVVITAVIPLATIISLSACKKKQDAPAPRAEKEAATVIKTPDKAAAKDDTPYKKTVKIFQEFAQIAEENAGNPDEGVRKCKEFVQKSVPQLKLLTKEIKKIEQGEGALKNMNEIMESNNRIKEVSDRVTKVAQEKYGAKGIDLLMSLSDLAMARL